MVLAMNVATALAWNCYFFALRHLEPALVNTIHSGLGPLTVLALAMAGVGMAKGKDPRKPNGNKAYVNGSAVDSKLIENAARETGAVIEPEAVPPSQRFDPARTADKMRRDGEGPAAPPSPKDAPRGN